MGITYSQMFPPAAAFTEKDLPNLHGKVYLVTGATSGIGKELATLLYHAGSTVWIAARSTTTATAAITDIQSRPSPTSTPGELKPLLISLDDLTTIKPAVQHFCANSPRLDGEDVPRLDVLFNNAGCSLVPAHSKSPQGFELMMATNCLGPYLLTKLLYPCLTETARARDSAKASVRVVWTASQYIELSPPKDGVMDLAHLEQPSPDQAVNYVDTKLGNWYLASEFAREESADEGKVLNLVQNPGNLNTNLLRHAPRLMQICVRPLLYSAKQGAYTELFAGLSPEVTEEKNGSYVIPWGRFHPCPDERLVRGLKGKEEGGTGHAAAFREWCEKSTEKYAL